jgi:hypothetical protein
LEVALVSDLAFGDGCREFAVDDAADIPYESAHRACDQLILGHSLATPGSLC